MAETGPGWKRRAPFALALFGGRLLDQILLENALGDPDPFDELFVESATALFAAMTALVIAAVLDGRYASKGHPPYGSAIALVLGGSLATGAVTGGLFQLTPMLWLVHSPGKFLRTLTTSAESHLWLFLLWTAACLLIQVWDRNAARQREAAALNEEIVSAQGAAMACRLQPTRLTHALDRLAGLIAAADFRRAQGLVIALSEDLRHSLEAPAHAGRLVATPSSPTANFPPARVRKLDPARARKERLGFLVLTVGAWATLSIYVIVENVVFFGHEIGPTVRRFGFQNAAGLASCALIAWRLGPPHAHSPRSFVTASVWTAACSAVVAVLLYVTAGHPKATAISVLAYLYSVAFYVGSLLATWSFAYLNLISRQRELAEESNIAELRRTMIEARNAMLREQINPHFLFNTLNAVHTLLLDHRGEAAAHMLDAMSAFLRRTQASAGDDMVTLGDELETQDAYLAIQRVRFGDRLDYRPAIPPEILAAQVPNLILQPLVENAIKHGLAATGDRVELSITAEDRDGVLVLSVRDDGGDPDEPAPAGLGVGLRNVEARLSGYYGEAASLSCHAIRPRGFLAEIRLPLLLPLAAIEADAAVAA